jgi:Zn-dependent protease
MNFENGSIRLFRVAGIDVLLHWSWAVVAFILLRARADYYSSAFWNIAEYLAIFGIVLLHEFGHAFACRSVGGQADRIVLWPLGGIAFVNPPPRPGAVLWSIAAGPLVNVILLPITIGFVLLSDFSGGAENWPDFHHFLFAVAVINGLLLLFNLVPIYPLDGGQIVQSLLWFVLGRPMSLRVVSVMGLIVGPSLLVVFVAIGQYWLAIMSGFVVLQSLNGLRAARILALREQAPRHQGLVCPSCGSPPLAGPYWRCDECGEAFDIFLHRGACPNCGQRFPEAPCIECRQRHPINAWWGMAIPADDGLKGHDLA